MCLILGMGWGIFRADETRRAEGHLPPQIFRPSCDYDSNRRSFKGKTSSRVGVVQSNLALRNFLVTTKKFLKVKSSLFQTFNQSTI